MRASRLRTTVWGALVALLLAAGGGTASAGCVPPAPAQMGACTVRAPGLGLTPEPTIHGVLGVDVSVYQGRPDWALAKRSGLRFAADKAGEGLTILDPTFVSDWDAQVALGIPHAAYWFLRPVSCTGQADVFAGRVRLVGGLGPDALPPVADAEVPLPAGCVAVFVVRLEHDLGISLVIVYTAPGTWPGGSRPADADLWVATYGPTPGCVWTCSHVAWQFSGGDAGPLPHSWPGIGTVDVDLDTGLLGLTARSRQLAADEALHDRLLGLRAKHRCWAAATHYGACTIWLVQIRALDKTIARES